MTRRKILFLRLWLVALMGMVSIGSLAQSDYELVIEMRDGTKYAAPIVKEWNTIYEQPHIQVNVIQGLDGNINAIFDVTWATGRIQVDPANVKRMYTQPVNLLLGDVNGDNVVDVADIVMTINYTISYIYGSNPPAGFHFANADMNGDGSVDETDITMMVNTILKK